MLRFPTALSLALTAALTIVPAAGARSTNASENAPGKYEVGIGSKSIAVDPDGTFKGGVVYLGGFGLGGPPIGDRHATGNLGVGPSVRAIAIGDGKNTFAVADIEAQGWFAATKDGPLGLTDMRKAVAKATDGKLPADHVVIQSDHTHGGPDMMGVWGGVPLAYRQYAFNQTVAAIKQAYNNRQTGTLWYGAVDGSDLLNNQFDYDAANKVMDSDVRVLQARDAQGNAFATMLNFSAHADVLGSGNRKATGDWVQTTNPMLEQRFGGKAMTVVGTLGRTQPRRPGCTDSSKTGDDASLCALDTYSKMVVDRAADAVAAAQPLRGPAQIAAESFLITDPSSSALLLGMLYGGAPLGIPINRSMTPPWLTGNVLGTVTASVRIGDVLLSAAPGEMYPQIPLKVRSVLESTPGIRGYITAGLANDQLGYLIAPYEAYPEPIKTSFFDSSFANGDVIGNCTSAPDPMCAGDPTPDPIGNDNYFFNVSHTMGERVTCSLLRGAGDVFGRGSAPRDAYERCATFPNDSALPEGSDITLSDATSGVPPIR